MVDPFRKGVTAGPRYRYASPRSSLLYAGILACDRAWRRYHAGLCRLRIIAVCIDLLTMLRRGLGRYDSLQSVPIRCSQLKLKTLRHNTVAIAVAVVVELVVVELVGDCECSSTHVE